MSKFDLKPKVISLRKKGKSLAHIASLVGISKSTASLWCNDIVLSDIQKKHITDKMKKMGKAGALKGAQKNREKKIHSQDLAKDFARNTVTSFSQRDLLIAGIALYWAEGSKAESTTVFIFVNSDPQMITFMYKWLMVVGDLSSSEIVAKVSINEIHKYRIEEVLNFWSNLLDLPRSQFLNTFFQKVVQKKTYDNHSMHYGVLRLGVRKSTFLKYKVLALIQEIKAGVAQVVRANAS